MATNPAADLKIRVIQAVDDHAELLEAVSDRIHAEPELMFEEHRAAELLASTLESAGFEVERGAFGLETAFRAQWPGPGPGPDRVETGDSAATVAILCEYDALPGIGHACGHNLIAAAGLGAGLAAAAVASDAGGGLVVMGTPAEEGGGGKVIMGERGAFEGLDAVLAIHPAGVDLTEPTVIAIATLRVEYFGQAAHAAAAPHLGRNALDAAVLGYNAVAALRQHIEATDRVHGVITGGGEKPNIVPDHTVTEWYVRSATLASLQPLKQRVLACLEAGAAAAGCRIEVQATCPEYSDLRSNGPLGDLYRANSESIGRPLNDPAASTRQVVSTDMGNVSYIAPSIHPMVKVAPDEVSLHTIEFARWAASPEGHRGVLDAAKSMAMTAVDIWTQPTLQAKVRAAFDRGP